MKVYLMLALLSGFIFNNSCSSQSMHFGEGFSIVPSVDYVSSASILLDAFSASQFERGVTEDLSGGYGYGLSLRKKIFNEDLSIGLTMEYLKIYDENLTEFFRVGTSQVKVIATEELWMLPVELAGYFNIPNFTEDLEIYLGGGIGAYFGDRRRTVANVQSETISKEPGFSFVILSGMELSFSKQVSGVFEIRFRQGEYKVKSEYPVSAIRVNGIEYPLDKNLNSKVFVDGLKLSLGIAYNF